MYKFNEFADRVSLEAQLTNQVAAQLEGAVKEKGWASIAVSGGSTPKAFFAELSKRKLPWGQITITLADDRWVETTHEASNAKLVREHLLVNEASNAKFYSLKQADMLDEKTLAVINDSSEQFLPFDVLILGMGEDGHTASIFPCSAELEAALDTEAPLSVNKVVPTTAPFDRITFNFKALEQSKHVYLHICGDAKKSVLDKALAGSDNTAIREMPIRAFLHHPALTTEVFWAE